MPMCRLTGRAHHQTLLLAQTHRSQIGMQSLLPSDGSKVGYCKLVPTRADLKHQVFKQGRYNRLACSIHRFCPRTQERLLWRKLEDRYQSRSSGGRGKVGSYSTRHRSSFLSAERSLMPRNLQPALPSSFRLRPSRFCSSGQSSSSSSTHLSLRLRGCLTLILHPLQYPSPDVCQALRAHLPPRLPAWFGAFDLRPPCLLSLAHPGLGGSAKLALSCGASCRNRNFTTQNSAQVTLQRLNLLLEVCSFSQLFRCQVS